MYKMTWEEKKRPLKIIPKLLNWIHNMLWLIIKEVNIVLNYYSASVLSDLGRDDEADEDYLKAE